MLPFVELFANQPAFKGGEPLELLLDNCSPSGPTLIVRRNGVVAGRLSDGACARSLTTPHRSQHTHTRTQLPPSFIVISHYMIYFV